MRAEYDLETLMQQYLLRTTLRFYENPNHQNRNYQIRASFLAFYHRFVRIFLPSHFHLGLHL